MTKLLLAFLPVALLVAACSKGDAAGESTAPSPTRDTSTAQPADAANAPIEVAQTRFIHAEPAELSSCDFTKVTLKWDASGAGMPIAVVEIYSGDAASTPGLFAAGGITGEKETGPWVRPGSTFSLRDKASGKELEKLVIGGPRCS